MPSIALQHTDVIVGVDTHKDEHVAVALDGLGGRLGERFVEATTPGYAGLLAWATQLGRPMAFGVEGHWVLREWPRPLLAPGRQHGDRGGPPTSAQRAATRWQE